MAKYIKKPVEVEAFQYFDDLINGTIIIPVWFNQAIVDGVVYCVDKETFIKTPEGNLKLTDSDWVLRGHSDERGYHTWINKPDYFEKAYEKV